MSKISSNSKKKNKKELDVEKFTTSKSMEKCYRLVDISIEDNHEYHENVKRDDQWNDLKICRTCKKNI